MFRIERTTKEAFCKLHTLMQISYNLMYPSLDAITSRSCLSDSRTDIDFTLKQ